MGDILHGIRYFHQDELVKLAERIPEMDRRMLFLDTIANYTKLQQPGQDGHVWVALYAGSSDRDWVEELEKSIPGGLTRVTFSK
jgi:hypothetical protein